MNYQAYFSPTGGTKKVVQYMGAKFPDSKEIDLSSEISDCHMTKEDFCIVGVPSFGGRVPGIAARRIQHLHGDRTPALLISTYGNRAYEDTLVELKDVLEKQGFVCFGAAAIVTQHSIMSQFGVGRPDQDDFAKIDRFVEEIKERLNGEPTPVEVPGNVPYKERHASSMHPQASESCIKCGLCAAQCPVHAIPAETPQVTDAEKCISCMRCVKICPMKARKCDEEKIKNMVERLEPFCVTYKQSEFF